MKLCIFFSLFYTASAGAKYPSISLNLKDGSYAESFDGLDPELSYSTEASAMGCDIEAGATASMKPTMDVLSLPRSIWGKVSGDVAGWRVSSRVDADLDDGNKVGINFAAGNSDLDASIQVNGLDQIIVEKGFDALDGRISVTPRYELGSSDADVTLAYDSDSTSVAIDASASASTMKLTVSQKVTDDDTLTPSINCSGDMSLAWKRSLGDGNSITTTVKPNEEVSLKWNDGPWVAEFKSSLDGYKTDGLSVRVNRKVSFV